MSWLDTKGVGSALRMLYRPGAMFRDAFDFLHVTEDSPAMRAPEPPHPNAREAIAEMRSAANRLSSVANAVIVRADPTPRQSIEQATDEAVDFHA